MISDDTITDVMKKDLAQMWSMSNGMKICKQWNCPPCLRKYSEFRTFSRIKESLAVNLLCEYRLHNKRKEGRPKK
jgi:hypothetical protein